MLWNINNTTIITKISRQGIDWDMMEAIHIKLCLQYIVVAVVDFRACVFLFFSPIHTFFVFSRLIRMCHSIHFPNSWKEWFPFIYYSRSFCYSTDFCPFSLLLLLFDVIVVPLSFVFFYDFSRTQSSRYANIEICWLCSLYVSHWISWSCSKDVHAQTQNRPTIL